MEYTLETLYCYECGSDGVKFCTITELWEKFSQIILDDELCLTEPIACFGEGTPVDVVLNWFDEHCPGGIEYLKEHGKEANAVSE